jgi:hypothetical protein
LAHDRAILVDGGEGLLVALLPSLLEDIGLDEVGGLGGLIVEGLEGLVGEEGGDNVSHLFVGARYANLYVLPHLFTFFGVEEYYVK